MGTAGTVGSRRLAQRERTWIRDDSTRFRCGADLPLSPSFAATSSSGDLDPSGNPHSAIHHGRGGALVSRLGSSGAPGELGKSAGGTAELSRDHLILVDVYAGHRTGVSVIQLFSTPEFLTEEGAFCCCVAGERAS